MAWLFIKDIEEASLPLDVFDAMGDVINRAITGFDARSGLVESLVVKTNGHYATDERGELRKRVERFCAPLTCQKISRELAARRIAEGYWDLIDGVREGEEEPCA